ncbi:MAG TPA: ATP-binding protein, partial [Streptosporangiaceae bacterium]
MAGLAVGRLYERDAELRMAADLLSRAADGRGGALFYAGDAGLGKTALVKHVIGNAAGDFRLGQAAGDPAETSLAFSFLGQATDALGCPVPLAEADTGRPSVRDVRSLRFHQVLRWLREVNEASEASEASEVGEPVLLVLDDLQWADSDSLAMLSFLCRRLDGLAVAVIGTLRAWPPSAYDVARRLWAAGRAGFAELAPLTDPAAERVVMARVRGQASAATISRAVTLCAGNPLLLEQVSGLICAGN